MNGFFAEDQFWDVSTDDDALIVQAVQELDKVGLPELLGEVQRMWACAKGDHGKFQNLVDRRATREPLSHLLGYRHFYKLRFAVTADVLDPRPDTETLVEAALGVPFQRVLDLGTGSGCILLSLLAERRDAVGVGTDVSQDALGVAARNAQNHRIDSVSFIKSHWFDSVSGTFDLIVSNPPYIAADEMAALQPEVRDHEPRLALTDEADGLSCYRTIVAGAPDYLNDNGHLIVEIGPTQAAAVSAMMKAEGFADIRVIQDLDCRDRVVFGQKTTS